VETSDHFTVFGQLFQKGKKLTRMFQGSKSAFEVYLANEGAEDAGGPFREIIDDVSQELRTEGVLPLL